LAWLLTLPPRPSAWLVIASGVPLAIGASWLVARRFTHERWGGFLRRTSDLHVLGVVLLVAFALQFADAHGVTTDGVIYFTQLRSAIFDRDLDVAAEFAFLQQPARPSHVVPIGPTFVWLPLYATVAAIDALGRALGLWAAPADAVGVGLTLPYIRAALVSSFVVGAVGLVVIHRRLRQEFAAGVTLSATLLLFLATPLVWYMVYEPSMTHAASFGFVALFVVAADRETSPAIGRWRAMVLGALLGLAFMTRPQEAVFALFPATLLLMGPGDMPRKLRACGRLALWSFLGALPCLVAQAVHSWVLLRREPFTLAGDNGYLSLLDSHWADTLWSSWHGFFSWTPIAYLAFIALFFYALRNRRWAIAAVLIVIVMAWVNGATADWAAGWSFGGRRFTSVLVVLAPGLALIVDGLVRRPIVALSMCAAAAVLWNQLLVRQYATGMLAPDTTVSFGQIVRQQAALATRSPFVYPFAFPANAWFAWRTGLGLDRYDLLGAERFGSAITLSMSAASGRYLLEGWTPRVSDAFGELRWIEGSRAGLIVPLGKTRAPDAVLTVRARTRLLDPPEIVRLAVSVNGRELGTVTPAAREASVSTIGVPASVLVDGFNYLTFERRSGAAPVGIYEITIR
jgi:hypothetical protein